jgi:hypothetical protein
MMTVLPETSSAGNVSTAFPSGCWSVAISGGRERSFFNAHRAGTFR